MSFPGKKTTVLYVDEAAAYGGSLIVIGRLIDGLDKTLFRSVLVGDPDTSELAMHMRSSIRIYSIPRLYNYVRWGKTLDFIDRLPGCLFRRIVNYIFSFIRTLFNSIYFVRLFAVILKEKVDIIHVSNGMNNFAPVLAAVLLRRKFLVHFHGIENPGFIQRQLIRQVPVFIAISHYMKGCLVDNGFPEDAVSVLPNPVRIIPADPQRVISLRERHGITGNNQVIGIVGRIVRWKGHVEFLRAADSVMRARPGLKLLIVGDYSDGDKAYQETITNMVNDSEFSDRIILTGYTQHVADHYALMDVCVHASIEPEPFGLVITEAMSHGVPVIASDRGAPPEIIRDGVDGYLVNPEVENLFANKMQALLDDRALRDTMGARAKQRVLKEYDLSAYARKMENMYLSLLRGQPEQVIG